MIKNQAMMRPVVVVLFLYYLISQGAGLPVEGGECPSNYFMCLDGKDCIEIEKHCDGTNDCGDGTDEYDCSAEVTEATVECGENSFRCEGSDKCLADSKLCDGNEDCADGSDEHNCEKCEGPDNFRCDDGICIKSSLLCDNKKDCPNGYDESNCTFTATTTTPPDVCTKDEYRCPDGTCMSKYRLCDGQEDCHDGSDEIHGCSITQLSTEESTLEQDDHQADTPEVPVVISMNTTGNCSEDEFRCLDGTCIPHIQVCNKEFDCPDRSDEIHGCTQDFNCWDGFLCKNGHCIPKEWRCDKNVDCTDGSDEQFCGGKFRRTVQQKTFDEEKVENLVQERKLLMEIHHLKVELLELQQSVAKEELRVAKAAGLVSEAIAEEQIRAAQLNRQAAEDKLRYQSELHWLEIEARTSIPTVTAPVTPDSATSQEA